MMQHNNDNTNPNAFPMNLLGADLWDAISQMIVAYTGRARDRVEPHVKYKRSMKEQGSRTTSPSKEGER